MFTDEQMDALVQYFKLLHDMDLHLKGVANEHKTTK